MAIEKNGVIARYPSLCSACLTPITVGGKIYPRRPHSWVCSTCAPTLESQPPTAAEVLTKVTRDMVTRSSVSVTNEEAEVLVRTVLAVVSSTVPIRRPVQTLPPGGRWFNLVTGWDGSTWMDDWTPEEIIGYVFDAIEDGRSTNLNKGAIFRLLRFMETATGTSFFLRDRLAKPADASTFTGFSRAELVDFHRRDLPNLGADRYTDGSVGAGTGRQGPRA